MTFSSCGVAVRSRGECGERHGVWDIYDFYCGICPSAMSASIVVEIAMFVDFGPE